MQLVLKPLPEAPTGSAILELGGTPKTDAITATVRSMKVELRIGKASPAKWNTPKCHYPTSTTTDTASVLTPSVLPKDQQSAVPRDAGDIQDLDKAP